MDHSFVIHTFYSKVAHGADCRDNLSLDFGIPTTIFLLGYLKIIWILEPEWRSPHKNILYAIILFWALTAALWQLQCPALAQNIGNLAVTGSCQVFAQPSSYDCENDEWSQYFIWNYSLLNIGPENWSGLGSRYPGWRKEEDKVGEVFVLLSQLKVKTKKRKCWYCCFFSNQKRSLC